MKLLYVASDQSVPGATGGSVHVEEVARGMAALGHELHVVAQGASPDNGIFRVHSPSRLSRRGLFRWTAQRELGQLIDAIGIEAIMERFYNFGGEGIRAAHERQLPSLLEVNSPLVDHPGSMKALLDGLLLFRPMRRLRDELCRKASAIVTPLPAIVPEGVPAEKVCRVHWGANVDRFHPGVEPKALAIPAGRQVVIFSGSFRPWHGADLLARAAARILRGPRGKEVFFLFVGDGPTRSEVEDLVSREGIAAQVLVTGAVPYAEMPQFLARASIGVAPYQPRRLGQMKLGFYWSPLKIFEYMATGLPVVTLDVEPLRAILRHGEEGFLIENGEMETGLVTAIETLLEDRARAKRMGQAGRERVVAQFSWRRHCEQLEQILERLVLERQADRAVP